MFDEYGMLPIGLIYWDISPSTDLSLQRLRWFHLGTFQKLDNLLVHSSNTTNIITLKNLTFRPLSEAFVRRSWYSVLPILDTMGRCRVKKAVVCVAQFVAALIVDPVFVFC